ncbi:hypothetical protein NHQ30_004426 [Ciborinia camelliae]|nr:hypothetical protein NHQ30_004426 [Ciborinia camelliae]
MAISKQQLAIVDKIISYKPTTWASATEVELENIPLQDHAEFGEILMGGISAYRRKVQNAASILKRGPNLNPEINTRPWATISKPTLKKPAEIADAVPQVVSRGRALATEPVVADGSLSGSGSLQLDDTDDLALDETQRFHASSVSNLKSPKMQFSGNNDRASTSFYRTRNNPSASQPKHLQLALAAAAELETINQLEFPTLHRSPQEKPHRLRFDERERHVQEAAEEEDALYGVGDKEFDRLANARKLYEGTTLSKQIKSMQAEFDHEADIAELNREMEDVADESFSLREMIDAMEYLAEHPWVCENGMVDHVWDEYKLFQEYTIEALKVAEEETEELQRASANEGTASTHNGKGVDRVSTNLHRTRSMNQTTPASRAPPHRISDSLRQEDVAGGVNSMDANTADRAKRVSAAATASYRSRNFQRQIAAVYEALPNQTPPAFGPTSAHSPPPRSVTTYSPPTRRSASTNNPAPPQRPVPIYSAPTRRSAASTNQKETVDGGMANDSTNVDNTKKAPKISPSTSRAHSRRLLQVAAVYKSLGRQNEMPRGAFEEDGI